MVATTDPTIATLTLTSCHPRYTARDRIVITSELDPTQSDPVGESVLNYGRPLEPAAEAPPIRLDDPVVSAPPVTDTPATTSTATDTSIPASTPTSEVPTTDPGDEVEPAAVTTGIADSFAEGWFSDPSANSQVALWGAVLILISVGSYLLSRKVRRDWVGLLVGIVPFTIALYFFFQNVNRLLPTGL